MAHYSLIRPWIVEHLLQNSQEVSRPHIIEIGDTLKDLPAEDVSNISISEDCDTICIVHDRLHGVLAKFMKQDVTDESESVNTACVKDQLRRGAFVVVKEYSFHLHIIAPNRFYFCMQVDNYCLLDANEGFQVQSIYRNCMTDPAVYYLAEQIVKQQTHVDTDRNNDDNTQDEQCMLSQLLQCMSQLSEETSSQVHLDTVDRNKLNLKSLRSRKHHQLTQDDKTATDTAGGSRTKPIFTIGSSDCADPHIKKLAKNAMKTVYGTCANVAAPNLVCDKRKCSDLLIGKDDQAVLDDISEWRYDYQPPLTQSASLQQTVDSAPLETSVLTRNRSKGKAPIGKSVPPKSSKLIRFANRNNNQSASTNIGEECDIRDCLVVIPRLSDTDASSDVCHNGAKQASKHKLAYTNEEGTSGSKQKKLDEDPTEITGQNISDELEVFTLQSSKKAISNKQPEQSKNTGEQPDQYSASALLESMGKPSGEGCFENTQSGISHSKAHQLHSTQSMSQTELEELHLSPIKSVEQPNSDEHLKAMKDVDNFVRNLISSADIQEEVRLASIAESPGKCADAQEENRLANLSGVSLRGNSSGQSCVEMTTAELPHTSNMVEASSSNRLAGKTTARKQLITNAGARGGNDDSESLFTSSEEKDKSVEIVDVVMGVENSEVIIITDSAEQRLGQDEEVCIVSSSSGSDPSAKASNSEVEEKLADREPLITSSCEENQIMGSPEAMSKQDGAMNLSSQSSSEDERNQDLVLLSNIEELLQGSGDRQLKRTPSTAASQALLLKVSEYWTKKQT